MSIDTKYGYNIKSGTVDNKNPKSVYLQISAWGKPKENYIDDYDFILRKKSKRVKSKLFQVLDEECFYKDKSIIDFNMASSGISYGKRSFMSVEITLFKKEPLLPVNSNQMVPIMTNISEKIIKEVFEKDEDFKFYKRKT